MDPEVDARANVPVVLINRDGLYVIIAVLGVSILGCACVLAYSLGNYDKLKKNAAEIRSYVGHHGSKAAEAQHSGGKDTAAAGNIVVKSDVRSVTTDTLVSMAPENGSQIGPSFVAGRNASDFASVVRSVSNTFAVAAKQRVSGAVASEAQIANGTVSDGGSGTIVHGSSDGETLTTRESASPWSLNVSWNRPGRGVREDE
ncbi:hypothetical protein HPB50_023530 [Hyalomma asiaticum]|uniref:Uncharacterized protein n=1 Tax=Hyalomma asiaticum TaxID=266040 RepID=A0ACB7RZM1_HYAAI|nr:hypothetical protein HPB50_023530 [Hyalomma asiaticum]